MVRATRKTVNEPQGRGRSAVKAVARRRAGSDCVYAARRRPCIVCSMQDQRSRLRHDLRSAFNNIRLCTAAFETETDPREQVQWLAYIEAAVDKCIETVEEMERLGEPPGAAGRPG